MWVLIQHYDNGASEIVDKHRDKRTALRLANGLAQKVGGVTSWTIAPESQADRYISAGANREQKDI